MIRVLERCWCFESSAQELHSKHIQYLSASIFWKSNRRSSFLLQMKKGEGGRGERWREEKEGRKGREGRKRERKEKITEAQKEGCKGGGGRERREGGMLLMEGG